MAELEKRAAHQLNKVLNRLASEGYMDTFTTTPYSKNLLYPSPQFPDFSVLEYQGVFIDVSVHGQDFHLDFDMLNWGLRLWQCYRDQQHIERRDPLQKGKGDILTTDYSQKPDDVILPLFRIDQIRVEELVRGYSERSASLLINRYPAFRQLERALGNIGLNPEEMTRFLGYHEVAYPRKEVFYLGKEKSKEKPRENYSVTNNEDEEEVDEVDQTSERIQRLSFFDKLQLWRLELAKLAHNIKGYKVEGMKVTVDLSDQFEDVYEELLARKVRNSAEVERSILWTSIYEAIEEKCFEGVEEDAYWNKAVARKKIKPYIQFLQNKLGNQ